MKTLYLDCQMGAAGDMLTAALLELCPSPDDIIKKLNSLGIPHVQYVREKSEKCGICGTHISVLVSGHEEHEHHHDHEHEHHHDHSSMDSIAHIVSHMNVKDKIKTDILAVYKLIAEAESHVHGKPVTEIHFHEVGSLDAIADITAVCVLMDELSPVKVICSPVHTGSGTVKCAHGYLPVPAPATAYILRDVPIYSKDIHGELCTPTGAALLKHFVTEFAGMPVMKTQKIGYGMGRKDFPQANCVRAFSGETKDETDTILELSCNIDDMTAEDTAFACEILMEKGARDVFTIPIGMKKSRPGTLLCVICDKEHKDELVKCIFAHTSTLGIRETEHKRYVLSRRSDIINTQFGSVRIKRAEGYGVKKQKFEYDDLARIAKERRMSIDEVRRKIEEDGFNS